jgi:hypothetical protein
VAVTFVAAVQGSKAGAARPFSIARCDNEFPGRTCKVLR